MSEIRVFVMVRWLSPHTELLCMLLVATSKVAPSFKFLWTLELILRACVRARSPQVSGSLQFLSGKQAEKPRAIHLTSCFYTFPGTYSLETLRHALDRAEPVTIQGALQHLSWSRL